MKRNNNAQVAAALRQSGMETSGQAERIAVGMILSAAALWTLLSAT